MVLVCHKMDEALQGVPGQAEVLPGIASIEKEAQERNVGIYLAIRPS